MLYKVPYSRWKDSLEVGQVVEDVKDVQIKIVTIIKITSYEGDTIVDVIGVKVSSLED